MLARIGKLLTREPQHGDVGGKHLAALVGIGVNGILPLVELGELEWHPERAEVVADALRVGRLAHYANACSRQLKCAGDALRLAHHEALAVEDEDAGKADAERGVMARRHGDVAGEHVDLAIQQRRETLALEHRAKLDGILVAENGHRQGAAEVTLMPLQLPSASTAEYPLGPLPTPQSDAHARARPPARWPARGKSRLAPRGRARWQNARLDERVPSCRPLRVHPVERGNVLWTAQVPLLRPTLVHEPRCVPRTGHGQVLTFARPWVRRRRAPCRRGPEVVR